MKYELSEEIQNELKQLNYSFSLLNVNELDDVLDLYRERTKWFKEKGIKQWGKYLEHHPKEEFIDVINERHYFIIKEQENIIAGFELSTDSKYWEDDMTKAYYIYKLVTKVESKNVGNIIMKICEYIALNNNKNKLRLDCLKNNIKLNNIYENYGFELIKNGYVDSYSYSLREKCLDE